MHTYTWTQKVRKVSQDTGPKPQKVVQTAICLYALGVQVKSLSSTQMPTQNAASPVELYVDAELKTYLDMCLYTYIYIQMSVQNK